MKQDSGKKEEVRQEYVRDRACAKDENKEKSDS